MFRSVMYRRVAAAALMAAVPVPTLSRRFASDGKAAEPGVVDKAAGLAQRAGATAAHGVNVAAEQARYMAGKLNAVDLLTNQHVEAKTLLAKIAATTDPESRHRLLEQLCDALMLHMRIEEEIFYPTVKRAASEEKFVEHSKDEHKEAKNLIADILVMHPGHAEFDAKLRALTNNIHSHASAEESELFPAARRVMDESKLCTLGEQMHKLSSELSQQEEKPRDLAWKDTGRTKAKKQ